jgi:hypothetical protein
VDAVSVDDERQVQVRQALPRFFRIVRSDPPTRDDFLSNEAKGKRARGNDPEVLRLWSGISVYDSPRRARATARIFPYLGISIAELSVPDDGSIVWERTTAGPGHYTLWGDPDRLLSCVRSVWTPNDVKTDEKGDA